MVWITPNRRSNWHRVWKQNHLVSISLPPSSFLSLFLALIYNFFLSYSSFIWCRYGHFPYNFYAPIFLFAVFYVLILVFFLNCWQNFEFLHVFSSFSKTKGQKEEAASVRDQWMRLRSKRKEWGVRRRNKTSMRVYQALTEPLGIK